MESGHVARIVVGLTATLALAILAAHPRVRQLERRLGITVLLSTGVPFLALGAIFRQRAVGILTPEILHDLQPAFEFGLGWIGFVVGVNFDVRRLDRLPRRIGNVLALESMLPMLTTAAACAITLLLLGVPWQGASFARDALVFAACAAASAPVAIETLTETMGEAAARCVSAITELDEVVALAALGFTVILFRPETGASAWVLPGVAWFLVTLGLGGILGIVAYLLLRGARSGTEALALLLGAVALSAGMAEQLALSVPVVCAIAGALLANLPMRDPERIRQTLLDVERPLYLVFLVVVGAEWNPWAWQGWVIAPVFVLARVVGKTVAAQWSRRAGPAELPPPRELALALLPLSPISIVVIVSAATVYQSTHVDRVRWGINAVHHRRRPHGGRRSFPAAPAVRARLALASSRARRGRGRMIRALVLLALIAALSFAARSFVPGGTIPAGSGSVLAFGFLLLAAIQTGHVFHGLRLPHLTGFILCGALFGPEVLGLLTPGMVGELALVKRVAVGLIALNAGCELNFKALRPRLRTIGAVSTGALVCAFVLLFGLFAVLVQWLPLAHDMTQLQRLVVALVCANVLTALSPAVVMGIISETRSRGPLTELALSIVVLADLAIVVTFSLTGSAVGRAFPGMGPAGGLVALAAHIFGSIGVGMVIGAVVAIYIGKVGRRVGLFVFGVSFVVAEAGGALHLDPLLAGLAAGLFLENVSPVSGHEVIRHTQPAAMPTFAVFFAVVGAEVHLHTFVSVAGWAVLAALVRAVGLNAGVRIGARMSGLAPELARRVPYGLYPQAGIAIGLANLIQDQFRPWGETVSLLLLGSVLVNRDHRPRAVPRVAAARGRGRPA